MNDPQRPIVCITGISGGLGQAFAGHWRSKGWLICGISRQEPPAGTADIFVPADLSVPGSASEAIGKVLEATGGRLDMLINNAGFGAYAAWSELPEADFRRMMEVDLFAPVQAALAALDALEASRGCIVNISSVAGCAPVPGMGAYSTAKFAVRAFSETLAWEVAGRGIRVVTVFPGRIPTGFSSRAVRVRPVPETPRGGASAAALAAKVYRKAAACGRGRVRRSVRIVYPGWYRLFIKFTSLFPNFYGRGAARVWKFR